MANKVLARPHLIFMAIRRELRCRNCFCRKCSIEICRVYRGGRRACCGRRARRCRATRARRSRCGDSGCRRRLCLLRRIRRTAPNGRNTENAADYTALHRCEIHLTLSLLIVLFKHNQMLRTFLVNTCIVIENIHSKNARGEEWALISINGH